MGVIPLLRLLADCQVHSVRSLGERLGVSEDEIRARAGEFDALGLQVAASSGGYRLAEPVDFIDADLLDRALHGASSRISVEVVDECASTNTLMLERARHGAPHALALACECQTAGRGRRGRQWRSRVGSDLIFSLLWRFECGAAGLAGLSLAAGVALVRALERLGYSGIALKWPNDLMREARKLGGVLIELIGERAGSCIAVIGVGINVRWDSVRAREVDQPAAGLAQPGGPAPPRTALLAAMLIELDAVLSRFAVDGFGAFRAEWIERHAWQGRPATLTISAGNAVAGEIEGVDAEGALLLRSSRGLERFHSGELRLGNR